MEGECMPVYVDDLGLFIASSSPAELMRQGPLCIDLLSDCFAKFDMTMNLGVNKTEA